MKRHGNLYSKVYDIRNLLLAEKKAMKGKRNQKFIIEYNLNRKENLLNLQYKLKTKTYQTSEYKIFKIFEYKEREIFSLPFIDRICHHAIMNIIEPIFTPTFTSTSFACIKGRGIHAASNSLTKALKNKVKSRFCLKLDIKKYYPSIPHHILKQQIRRKIKDLDLLYLLDEIIDSISGIPIGNYTSQIFSNIYLNGFDHWLKQEKKVYFEARYCDDIIILDESNFFLHNLIVEIKDYLWYNLGLIVKNNWAIFPVTSRYIDFVGYPINHTNKRLRKRIKKGYIKMLKYRPNRASISSYRGWLLHANCKHLEQKLLIKNI